MADAANMRCYYVLVHGGLSWQSKPPQGDNLTSAPPKGFLCYRYVLAAGEKQAEEITFGRVRDNLDKQTGWLTSGLATLDLEAEEISPAPMHKLLKRENRGHTFYTEE